MSDRSRFWMLMMLWAATPFGVHAESLDPVRERLIMEEPAAALDLLDPLLASALPAADRHRAHEYQGVALERLGRFPAALEAYRRVLEAKDPAPAPEVARRVRQRVTALLQKLSPVPDRSPQETPIFRSWGGISQEYVAEDLVFDDGVGGGERSFSVTGLQLAGRYAGRRATGALRFDATYLNPLSGSASEPSLWVQRGWIELTGLRGVERLRLGRQQLPTLGVSGRFDGLRLEVPAGETLRAGIVAGAPFSSPSQILNDRQRFVALTGHWSPREALAVSTFVLQQQRDGITDREAVGGMVAWRAKRAGLRLLLDYDYGYAALNLAQLSLDASLTDRFGVFAEVRAGASPYLTTGNALFGQRTDELERLGEGYSEDALRALARARTADQLELRVGSTLQLDDRWQVRVGSAYQDRARSPATEGVAAIPQRLSIRSWFQLTGNGLARRGDSWQLTTSFDSRLREDLASVNLAWRIPLWRRWQLTPELGATQRSAVDGRRDRLLLSPGLRLTGRFFSRYQIDLLYEHRDYDDLFTDSDEAVGGRATRFEVALRRTL